MTADRIARLEGAIRDALAFEPAVRIERCSEVEQRFDPTSGGYRGPLERTMARIIHELSAAVRQLHDVRAALLAVASSQAAPVTTARDDRQAQVFAWAQAAFSVEQTTSLPQRGLRLLEEAIEAFQATGGDPTQAHKLVDFVFSRPVGELGQELGGVSVCLLALAAAAGLSADAEEQREVTRVLSKPIEEFKRRNAAKNAAGFLAQGAPARSGITPPTAPYCATTPCPCSCHTQPATPGGSQ